MQEQHNRAVENRCILGSCHWRGDVADHLSDTNRQKGYGGIFSIDKEQMSLHSE